MEFRALATKIGNEVADFFKPSKPASRLPIENQLMGVATRNEVLPNAGHLAPGKWARTFSEKNSNVRLGYGYKCICHTTYEFNDEQEIQHRTCDNKSCVKAQGFDSPGTIAFGWTR